MIGYRNESGATYAIARFLAEHQIHFNVEEKSQCSNYIYDFYLPDGLKNNKQPLGDELMPSEMNGPTAIEVKGRLLFDTVQRYVSLYQEKLVPHNEVSSFLLVYLDGNLHFPLFAENFLNKLNDRGFYVMSLSQFLNLQLGVEDKRGKYDTKTYEWQKDRDKALEKAKVNMQDHDITLFLGAGVSMSANLPSWWNLLESLLCNSKQRQLYKTDAACLKQVCYDSSIVLGRFIRLMMETKSDGDDYYNAIHDAIYGGKTSFTSPLVTEICNLISTKRDLVKGIITYNFDDVMERALQDIGIKSYPVFGMNQPQQAFPVYHVHGYVPFANSEMVNSVPILSEEEYHRVYANSYNWSNVEQIHALSRTTCIFIGLSMTDPNLRRLLDIAIRDSENDARHFVFLPCIGNFRNVKDADKKNNEAMKIHKEIFLELGLRVIWYTDYAELPKLIAELT